MKIQEIKEQFGNCPTERLPELIEAYKEDERSGIKAEIAKAEKRLEALEKEKAGIPLGRGETPEEIAEAGINMMRSGFITGEILNINGGAFMRP